jgi:hypothetical protein
MSTTYVPAVNVKDIATAVVLAKSLVVITDAVTTLSVTIGPNRFFGRYKLDLQSLPTGSEFGAFIETSGPDAGSAWRVVIAREHIAEPGIYEMTAIGCDERVRARFQLLDSASGTTTVSLTGTSWMTFCNDRDLTELSIPPEALACVPDIVKAEAIVAATSEALSYLGGAFDLPITSWGSALRMHTANMAVYHIIRLGYTDAIEWLKKGARDDPTIVDTTPVVGSAGSYWISRQPRGWQLR